MPTFCRHNRFIERCPICSRTLPGAEAASKPAAKPGRATTRGAAVRPRHPRLRTGGREVRVHREVRAQDDGYASALAPGLHASGDAVRLAQEIAFASGRLLRMHAAPPDLFAEIRALATDGQLERATWMCFLTVYLSPLPGDDPFAGIRLALGRPGGDWDARGGGDARGDWHGSGDGGEHIGGDHGEGDYGGDGHEARGDHEGEDDVPSLDGIPLGPRTSHDPARGAETLLAYRHWVSHFGSQARAFVGEDSWTPQRRFERVFERLALPGLGRAGRYELLVTLGRLGLYELTADSLHLAVGRGAGFEDLTTVAAKRILAVGEPVYLERRALAFAQELSVPIDVLDLALANWGAGERATLGFRPDISDSHALQHVRDALGLDPDDG
jgi:hypothetical protein